MASGIGNADWITPDISIHDESSFSSQQDGEHHGNKALSLSMDSGTSSVELCQLQCDNDNVSYLCEPLDMSGFSEEELLNVTFEACDAAGRGEVLASTVLEFLQAMTGHNGEQDKLIVLKQMLDPEDQDLAMDRDTFHITMKKWITQCSQDGYPPSGPEPCKATPNTAEFFPSLTETTFTDQNEYHCDSGDLLGLVEELKHTRDRLRGQNSSLLRSISQCEEINLQLMIDVSELRRKLASAQLCAGRAQSLAEELDEARRALRESKERTSLAQAHSHSLINEMEHLKTRIKITEEMNEKLLMERNRAEDQLKKLKLANTDIGEELEEMRVLFAIKEKENTKKNCTLEKLKETFLDYHRVIDGLQCDLMRLQERSQKTLLRFDKSSSNLKYSGVPNHYTLQHEIQDVEMRKCAEENGDLMSELQPPSSPKKDLYNCNQKVKSAELQDGCSTESLQNAFLKDQPEQASNKQQLLTILRKLDQPRPRLDWQPERRQMDTHRNQEISKASPNSWWKAIRLGDMRHTLNTTKEMQRRIIALEAQLNEAQIEVQKSRMELGKANALTPRTDIAVQTEQVEDEWKCAVAEKVLETLRMLEAVVTRALKAAEVLSESERWMRERVEAVGCKVEEALSRTTDTDKQLSGLEARIYSCTKASDISERPDVTSSDCENPPDDCRNIISDFSKLDMINGDCFPQPGDEDDHRQQKDKDTTGHLRTLNDLSELLVTGESSSDPFPVGPLNKQNPPVQNCSEGVSTVAHDPVTETSRSDGCEARTHHDTREKEARFHLGLKETGDADESLINSLQNGQTFKLKENKSLTQEDTGRSRTSTSLESAISEVFDPQEKKWSAEPQQFDQTFQKPNFILDKGVEKSGGRLEEYSSKEKTNENVKDSLTQWTCCTPELENIQRSDAFEGGSVHLCQEQTAQPAETLEKEISAKCTAAEHPAKPSEDSSTPFFFPHTRSRPSTAPSMPTLPEEEEDSPEDVDSAGSSPPSVMALESKLVNVTLSPPTIVLPRQVIKQEPRPLEKARPHSPRPRLSRNTSTSGPITTVDNDGHVIDLVKDKLPEMQLSDEERQKNLGLLEEAKKVSDRFLSRRGRRSRCSLPESPTALSPNLTPSSSPVPSRSGSISTPPQTDVFANSFSSPSVCQRLDLPAVRDHGEGNKPEQKKPVELKPPEKRKVSSGTLNSCRSSSEIPKELTTSSKGSAEPCVSTDRGKKSKPVPTAQKPDSQTPATGVAKPVPRPAMQQAPCTAEIKTIGAFPPLMRAVSWDTVGLNLRNGGPKREDGQTPSIYPDTNPPVNTPKLSKLREEHKLLRTQSISGSKLPDLNESVEQDQETNLSSAKEESKEKSDAMPNISDLMLRKLKLHRGLPGCAPPLTEKEVENAFVQLSLAFRNDNYTLETRLKQAERERNLTEENTEKELEEFKNTLKCTTSLWQNAEQRDFYQRLMETVAVLHRLANRLSSRAEMVGAVRQEKRMNKATEVMLQYVENLKRTYEKDHAELMEFKKLANQNSNRCYGSSMEAGDDGVPRTARSMSLTMGKALPRRRVSVAVVPKFNLLNIPGQTPSTAGPNPGPRPSLGTAAGPNSNFGPGALPVLCEANGMKSESGSNPAPQARGENGKVQLEQESEAATPAKLSCRSEEIRAEIKAKIEEEAYNKGYQDGLKRLKELQEVKEEEEKAEQKAIELEELTKEKLEEGKKTNRFRRLLDVFERVCPKILGRNRTLWILLTLFLGVFLLVNIIHFFSSVYTDRTDATAEKANVPEKKFLGVRVGSKSSRPE